MLRFADPEGMTLELHAVATPDEPLCAVADDIPPEHALQGFHSVRAYASDPARSSQLLEGLGFEGLGRLGSSWAGPGRQAIGVTAAAPPRRTSCPALARPGAGECPRRRAAPRG